MSENAMLPHFHQQLDNDYKAGEKLLNYCPKRIYLDSKCFSHRTGISQASGKSTSVIWHSFPVILLQAVTASGETFLNHNYTLSSRKSTIYVVTINKLIQTFRNLKFAHLLLKKTRNLFVFIEKISSLINDLLLVLHSVLYLLM